MKTGQKIVLGIGILSLLGVVAWYFYRRRWRDFDNEGNTQWLSGGGSGKLALQMASDSHGITKGDKLEIESKKPGLLPKDAVCTDVFKDKGFYWVATNRSAVSGEGDKPGRVRVVS